MSFPPVLDGHSDALLRLHRSGGSFLELDSFGHLDLPRAREGGFGGGFFAVFVPGGETFDRSRLVEHEGSYAFPLSPPVGHAEAAATAAEMAELLARTEAEADGALEVVRDAARLEECLREGVLAAILHLEGAEPVAPDLSDLEAWYGRGVRSLGIVWSRPNAFGEGVPFRFPSSPDTGSGLSAAGRALVRACNRLGILVDVSHLNERGFRDVARLTGAPLVATHSNAHAVCPSSRNLTDEQLRTVAASGGVVGVAFDVTMLRPDGRLETDAPLADVVRHVDHVAGVAGIECVALGSDFDGCAPPDEIGDVTGLPRVLEALAAAGYGEDDLARIAHGNWLRVLRATWQG